MGRVDFKVTAWERMQNIPEKFQEQLKNAFESGEIRTSNDLFVYIEENLDPDAVEYGGFIAETEDQLTPEENHRFATIEFYDDDDNLIWANGKV